MIKKLIGKLTAPPVIYVNGFDEYWVPSLGMPDHNGVRQFEHPHCYQQVEQNWYGKWEKKYCWIGQNTPLVKEKENEE